MLEGKDLNGYVWVQDLRNEDYYYLKDFEHLIVTKVSEIIDGKLKEYWEAIVFEDEKCQKILGRQEFPTMLEAQKCLETYLEVALKHRKEESQQ